MYRAGFPVDWRTVENSAASLGGRTEINQSKSVKVQIMATINDLVLIHVDNKPGFYARVEDIVPDVKPGWWQVTLLVLTFPLQVFTWILDDLQLEGADFTMGGTPLRLEDLVSPVELERIEKEKSDKERARKARLEGGSPKVISLLDRRKK